MSVSDPAPTETRTRTALTLIFGVLYLVPLFLTAIFHIHPTTTMVHEQLSINYLSHDFFGIGYFLTETGQFSILLLAYPASFASHILAGGTSNYLRMEVFIQAYYLVHGVLLWLVAWWIIRNGRLGAAATIGLLCIPLIVPTVEQVTNLGLMINYNKATDLVLLILGYATVARARETISWRWPVWVAAGCLVGFAVGVKLSIGIIAAVFAAGILLSGEKFSLWRGFIGRIFAAAMAVGTSVFLGLWMFHRFNVGYLRTFLGEIVDLYRSGFLAQHTPFLGAELGKVLSPSSYYFADQLLLVAWLVSLVLLGLISHQRNAWVKLAPLIASQLLVFAFLLFQLSKRFTQGTMIDITAILGFAFVVNLTVAGLSDAENRRMLWGRWLVGVLVVVVVAGIANAHFPGRFHSMIVNSRELARLEKLQSAHPELDCIYFGKSLLQPNIFPSPDLVVQMKAPSATAGRFMSKIAPRMRWKSSDDPLPATSFIAIVADCVRMPARTPAALANWPEMYEPYDAEVLFPSLLRALESRATERLELQFVPLQTDDQLLYYFMYATRVRVFVVNPTGGSK